MFHRGKDVISNSNTTMALRCLNSSFSITDYSKGYIEAGQTNIYNLQSNSNTMSKTIVSSNYKPCPFMSSAIYESLRFLNCDFFFSEQSLNSILRALHLTTKRERKRFFSNILSCRRRMSKKFTETPIAKLFSLSNQWGMLKQRAQSIRLCNAIKSNGIY